jgi:hypothetical protein
MTRRQSGRWRRRNPSLRIAERTKSGLHAARIIDNGLVADAALQAPAMHQWLTGPDCDRAAEVQRAERRLAELPSNTPALLGAAQAMHRWLDRGEKRAPMRAALVRHWTRTGLLRAPVPLTGARAQRRDPLA